MIENVKKVIDLVADLQKQYKTAMADGKFNIPGDLFGFIGHFMAVQGIIESGPAIWNELKNASHPDRAELEDYIKGKDFGTDSTENLITKIADTALAAIALVDAVKGLTGGTEGE